jgi:hypothetical protein
MGWQKGKKHDSLLGHGLMIGNAMKKVVEFHNYSSTCGFCQQHSKKIDKQEMPNLLVPDHSCPNNYTGSSKGMEAKAALNCVNQVWSHAYIEAFVSIICLNSNASTRAYIGTPAQGS